MRKIRYKATTSWWLVNSGRHRTDALKTPGQTNTINQQLTDKVFKQCWDVQAKRQPYFFIQEVLYRPIPLMSPSLHANQRLTLWLLEALNCIGIYFLQLFKSTRLFAKQKPECPCKKLINSAGQNINSKYFFQNILIQISKNSKYKSKYWDFRLFVALSNVGSALCK